MKISKVCSCILAVSVLSWVSLTLIKPFPHQQDQSPSENPKGAAFDSKQGVDQKSFEGVNENYGGEYYRWLMGRLGSIPPNCAHRCEGCVPCVPVQMPTTTNHFGVQYANYEPEGWKCKCRSTFFNP